METTELSRAAGFMGCPVKCVELRGVYEYKIHAAGAIDRRRSHHNVSNDLNITRHHQNRYKLSFIMTPNTVRLLINIVAL